MNTHTTIEKMRTMRMSTMASLYHQATTEHLFKDLSSDDFVSMLIDTEWEARQTRRIANLIKTASFNQGASPTDIDYSASRSLDKTTMQRLLSLQFMQHAENIIITGPTGVGKSYLGQAIGVQACQMLHRTAYFVTARYFDAAKLAKLEGTYLKLIKQLQKCKLLILDDFGLHSLEQADRQFLLDLIEQRTGKASTIICSQIPVSSWHEMIGESTIADAILDRVVHSSHRIELKGESLRKKQRLNI